MSVICPTFSLTINQSPSGTTQMRDRLLVIVLTQTDTNTIHLLGLLISAGFIEIFLLFGIIMFKTICAIELLGIFLLLYLTIHDRQRVLSLLIANSQTWTPVIFGDNNGLRLCLDLVLHLHIVNAPLVCMG